MESPAGAAAVQRISLRDLYDKLVFGADRVKRVLYRETEDERDKEGQGGTRTSGETGSDWFV